MTDKNLHRELVDQPGSRDRLNTPALIVDLDALNRNIDRMTAFARANRLNSQPQVKTHKSPDIARLQIAAGGMGLRCPKMGEVEVMAEHCLTHGRQR
jgi:D-serine deaminase-like pyridoxal phosphate-dependent protein